MNVGQYVKTQVKIEKGMTIGEVADKMTVLYEIKIDSKKLSRKLNTNKLTGVELVAISKIVGFSLDELKDEVEIKG